MSREETRDYLIELIEPLLESMGYELVRLDYAAGKHGKLHLFIDSKDGITIDDCETASRAVSDLLDAYDPISHAYTLEVSSPGLERPLTKKEHFVRFRGEKVKVKTSEPIGGSKNFSGVLQDADSDSVEILKADGSAIRIPHPLISRANLWYTGPEKSGNSKN